MAETMLRRVERLSGDEACPKLRGWPLLIGFVFAVPASAALLVHAAARGHTLPTAIYAGGLVALYGVGWIYHMLRWSPGARAWLRRVDHAVIYLFIAATYTPIAVVGLHDAVGYWLLAAAWAGAAAGAIAKLVSFEGSRVIGGTMYIVVGWLPVVAIPHFVADLGIVDTILMFGGGIFYTAGAAVLAARRPDPLPELFGYHEVWHTMVVVASAMHYVLIWRVMG
ncbi:MAG: hemolysin III family protein [Acidimicrobiia bacterium]|nr:hemolysin III family protein [Acidimicrobiia bacterium]